MARCPQLHQPLRRPNGRLLLFTGAWYYEHMVSKYWTFLPVTLLILLLPFFGASALASQDTIIKGSSATLYYYASDGFRYVFPNEKVFFSWFNDFSGVKTVSDQELAAIPLKANVTYRPGIRLVKLQTDPKTYAVDRFGTLRWIQSEEAAKALYGDTWNKNVDDVADSFFVNYTVGEPIVGLNDFNPETVASQTTTINSALGLAIGPLTPQSNTVVGRSSVRLSSDVLPDLVPLAPYELRYDTLNGRTILRFTATFWNSGDAALELTANGGSGSTDESVDTFQKIYQKDGTARLAEVGEFLWHSVHGHYHFANFADYTLFPALASEFKTSNPTVTEKTTFCMRDDLAIDTSLPGAPDAKGYTICGKNRQGVSVGWADRYPSSLPDQYIDVNDVTPGIYRLSFVVDPSARFTEKNVNNNTSATIVELNPATHLARVIGTGAAYKTTANHFPDGSLIRGENDFTIYAIKNNAKRALRSSDVITSYGSSAAQAYVLPDGVVSAIPDTRLVRLSGTSSIYVLNEAGYRRRILTPEIMQSYGYAESGVVDINSIEFASYPESDLIMRSSDSRVYSVSKKRFVAVWADLVSLGYKPDSVHIINDFEFNALAVEVVASDLVVPWDVAFLPDGDMLVTERPGTVRRIGAQNAVIDVPAVRHVGEGGLMGMVLHPDFATNQYVYLYFTTDDGGQSNRIVRFRLVGNELVEDRLIIQDIPSSIYHDGGRMAFGPDGMLYATTGDASQSDLAQDVNSLAGKTLRLKPDGSIPSDNPFGTAVWSYGHRNSQGLTWDAQGRLWETEHGRSGALSGFDELNLVEKGKNYGWPTIEGSAQRDGMVTPVLNSTADYTWAPAGMAFVNNRLYFAGLRGSELYAVDVFSNGHIGPLQKYLSGVYGRLRAVVLGPDGFLYVTTSNRDGRGTVRANDDKILRIHPDFL